MMLDKEVAVVFLMEQTARVVGRSEHHRVIELADTEEEVINGVGIRAFVFVGCIADSQFMNSVVHSSEVCCPLPNAWDLCSPICLEQGRDSRTLYSIGIQDWNLPSLCG